MSVSKKSVVTNWFAVRYCYHFDNPQFPIKLSVPFLAHVYKSHVFKYSLDYKQIYLQIYLIIEMIRQRLRLDL